MKIKDLFESYRLNKSNVIRPYLIAEIGVNHEGSIDNAKRLIDEACEGGADAAKFQTYRAETLACKVSPAYWDTSKESITSQFTLFSRHDKFWKKEMELLQRHCESQGIDFLSTPFDIESATFLNDMMSIFKISSSDITNKPFIEFIASFRKPILLSTGASNLFEIQEAVSWIQDYTEELALMHCVLNYPTLNENANLGRIIGLKKSFPDYVIGYSDHTLPGDMKNLETAALLGAVIIEKHFTFDKTLPGNDHYHAMDKQDVKRFQARMNAVLQVIGDHRVKVQESESLSVKNARRSLVAKRNLTAGHVVQKSDLTFKRPAFGISPRFIEEVVGRKIVVDVEEDTPLQWKFFDG
jgi:sialic acid synthase SpsE